MGNVFSTFVGTVLIYYIKISDKIKTKINKDNDPLSHTESLLNEESFDIERVSSSQLNNNNKQSTFYNFKSNKNEKSEYQLLKNNEDLEFNNHKILEEIQLDKEIKLMNIDFNVDQNKDENLIESHENFEDLKKQIFNEKNEEE